MVQYFWVQLPVLFDFRHLLAYLAVELADVLSIFVDLRLVLLSLMLLLVWILSLHSYYRFECARKRPPINTNEWWQGWSRTLPSTSYS
jgi:hypothetical protein